MIMSITFNHLQSIAKRAFQAVFQPKEKLRSGRIHSFWNLLSKSTGSEPKMLLLPKSKLLETKPGAIASA